ncbi:MAG: Ig domain-containing protein, partial [Candidatus Theseobacter exili]|nr:Ig domain-containing protein [Candidatus Theseobacter exili]
MIKQIRRAKKKMGKRNKLCRYSFVLIAVLFFVFLLPSISSALTLTASPDPAPDGMVNVWYSGVMFTATLDPAAGEETPVDFQVFAGRLPYGLNLSTTDSSHAAIGGAPTSSGDFFFQVRANDDAHVDTQYWDGSITVHPSLGNIVPGILSNGTVNEPYSQNFNVTSGSGNYTWNLSGTLPSGLTFNSSTATLSGVPDEIGVSNFNVSVTDTAYPTANKSQNYSLVISTTDKGRILYIKNVERNEDTGIIKSTGDIYMRDLETGIETKLTDYTGQETILNPAFTTGGDEVVFTAKVSGVDYFRVFKISTDFTHADTEIGNPDIFEEFENIDLKYASLSPDGTKLVYTKKKNDTTTQLWMKDIADADYPELILLINQSNQIIRHPVFLDNGTIVYLGIINEIQDIYKVSINGLSLPVNFTNNVDPSPQYGRLQTSWRADTSYQNMVIYSKSVWQGYNWSDWNVEIGVISGDSL